ncbi:MAG TPA: putative toxin-antitoxin system toxin component, PIN family [Candidatus Angelobacter sp.]|nr:putative toxin-antitoxin system toxin component, PIN family [Candidatus Angelobacter sp.]
MLDVNVLVRAHERSAGSARGLLITLIQQKHTLLISSDMLLELATVLRYPRLQALYNLSHEQIYNYILLLRDLCESVVIAQELHVPVRDPKDIAILQTAVIGEADVLCTLDSDFFAPETQAFCATVGLEVLTDTQLLERLRRGPQPA